MKKIIKASAALLLFTIMCLSFVSCADKTAANDIWADAVHTEDVAFGSGSKTIMVEVIAQERSVTFTIKTDKENLGEALLEHNLISGENGPYGLYVKTVNGIIADYNINQTYWAITKNGESILTGVDTAEISDGEHYEFTCTK